MFLINNNGLIRGCHFICFRVKLDYRISYIRIFFVFRSGMILYSIAKFWDSTYRDDRWVKILFIFSVIINIGIWILLWLKMQPQSYLSESGEIPLHYNIYFGIDMIGSWFTVFIIPLIGLVVIIANNILGYIFYIKDKVISYALIIPELMIQLVLLIASFLLILLNS